MKTRPLFFQKMVKQKKSKSPRTKGNFDHFRKRTFSQPAITRSKLAIEMLEQRVKYVQT